MNGYKQILRRWLQKNESWHEIQYKLDDMGGYENLNLYNSAILEAFQEAYPRFNEQAEDVMEEIQYLIKHDRQIIDSQLFPFIMGNFKFYLEENTDSMSDFLDELFLDDVFTLQFKQKSQLIERALNEIEGY